MSIPYEWDFTDWRVDEWEMDRTNPRDGSEKRISNKSHPPLGQSGLIDKHYKWEEEQD